MKLPEMFVLDDGNPTTVAKKFVEAKRPHLKFWNGDFVDRNGSSDVLPYGNVYVVVPKGAMKAICYDFVERCYVPAPEEAKAKAKADAKGERIRMKTIRGPVTDAEELRDIDELRARVELRRQDETCSKLNQQ
jgi:hypothetical protein